ncbi:pyridine nucleotide-disulfide oxidoreductase [Pseudomonas sp. FH4]|jgi:sulfide:quinone oxidoreductase|uniref:NAD(P)/FAD-dependent oxidoreductase n=1 Tax=Pseudomonas brenneri TaxID=129817 RepID=A0A5B2V0M1_9PSED|nr:MULTISPECIES: FAD/NAD(P)-binding oxidoreductase [Pseudomonas]KAA6168608.1 NAD(P)/FAD-dependent oxidoreductase [Pseudomonas marginalis]ETK18192.1 pyridine nucleotide-disulfide oxidoreductase [Pseudomonas sp. FH4]KAA2231779.1 NAD(P)/FAD-dependent oxidoreductase [Pseudomonas brenneri]MBF8007171.1 NAD(P)/FAD-dependent oxidoreductase [Pseudomonas brenneri]TWR79405.1 NAD(P)/FAD-dependent oxidoreductase [Pseudomonas brenneri]
MNEQHCGPTISGDIVVIGGGSAGIGLLASLLKRDPQLNIILIEPSAEHYYQPAWTLVGGGAHDIRKTMRPMARVLPDGVTWVQAAVSELLPDEQALLLDSGQRVTWNNLIVCPGLRLAWEKIEGLEQTLGHNGVTSNYSYQHAAYTWQLVQQLKGGKAIFTQPAMPIKCAGAPQKALYLSCDHWLRQGDLHHIEVEFNLAGAALFGVATFVPPLMKYIEKYRARLAFNSNLIKVDGPARKAWFEVKDAEGNVSVEEKSFDLLHVVPPQIAPDFIRHSPLADAAGWCEVDPHSLQQVRYPHIFALGDVCSTSNAKTAAAVRKQIVVVAENLLALRRQAPLPLKYDGYGSCPLTVEKGKVVLAEFGYGGKLLPTFPLDPTVARRSAWLLKATLLPWFYWNGMLKGREWLTRLAKVD